MVDLQPQGKHAQFILIVEFGKVMDGIGQVDAQLHVALHASHGVFQWVGTGLDGAQHRVRQGSPGLEAAHGMIEQLRQLFDHSSQAALIAPGDVQS
ncbi:hypothetical protein D3C85_1705150 [compost metagenome]